MLAISFLFAMVWDDIETRFSTVIASILADADAESVVLSFTQARSSAASDAELIFLVDFDTDIRVCELASAAMLSRIDFAVVDDNSRGDTSAPQSADTAPANLDNNGATPISLAGKSVRSKFVATYRSILKFAAMVGLPRIQEEAVLSRTIIIGTISTYNPYRDGKDEGGIRTASGELYDPSAWTAAIQTGLRNQFGGVRYGRLYQPVYALVVSGEKRLIVKVNDVGPLKTGRVLDLNERSMRYFDPFLAQGLIQGVKVTVLPGEDWTPGPVGEAYAINFASPREFAAASDEQAELANMRARFGFETAPDMKADARAEVRLTGG